MTLSVLGVIIDIVIGSIFIEKGVKSICEMGFMRKEEIAAIKEKRSKELNKNAAKNDYTRGSEYKFEL